MKTYKVWENYHWILFSEISCHMLTQSILNDGMNLAHRLSYCVKCGFASNVGGDNNKSKAMSKMNILLFRLNVDMLTDYIFHRIALNRNHFPRQSLTVCWWRQQWWLWRLVVWCYASIAWYQQGSKSRNISDENWKRGTKKGYRIYHLKSSFHISKEMTIN